MDDWLKRMGLKRVKAEAEERQAQTAYQAACREFQRRRERLDAALDMEKLLKDMKEVRKP